MADSKSDFKTSMTTGIDMQWDYCNYHAVRMLTGNAFSVDVLLPGKWIKNETENLQNITYPDGWFWCDDEQSTDSECLNEIKMSPDYERIQHDVNYQDHDQLCLAAHFQKYESFDEKTGWVWRTKGCKQLQNYPGDYYVGCSVDCSKPKNK